MGAKIFNKINVTIIDYGAGNIGSIKNAFNYLNCNVVLTNEPTKILKADMLILPGNGAFKPAIDELNKLQLCEAIFDAVNIRKKKILGICLGMQLFAKESTEWGHSLGLGLYEAIVDKLSPMGDLPIKIPHIGFSSVRHDKDMILFNGLPDQNDFYFAHSYGIKNFIGHSKIAICEEPFNFIAAFEYENIYATQFHPEKSQGNGLTVLKNFIKI